MSCNKENVRFSKMSLPKRMDCFMYKVTPWELSKTVFRNCLAQSGHKNKVEKVSFKILSIPILSGGKVISLEKNKNGVY